MSSQIDEDKDRHIDKKKNNSNVDPCSYISKWYDCFLNKCFSDGLMADYQITFK